ncbi:MAG: alpha/beta hydrolase [Solirubrobacterales bacterium]|nr:alpha/beta hydrolase [Solirubrobacterales bacterium]
MHAGSIGAVTSADGTVLAFDRLGDGPPVIMAAGAFNDRGTTAPLSRALAQRCRVLNYDRRGRGGSGDTAPYAVQREIEDLAALIGHAGRDVAVFGYSSGANLALRAAAAGLPIGRLVLYEPPYNAHDDDPRLPADLSARLAELVAAGRRGDAVELYQTVAVGIPEPVVAQLREAPFRPALEAIAHTLAYDAAILGDRSLPSAMLAAVRIPTLVICGDRSVPFLRSAAHAVAATLPDARLTTLADQSHDIDPTTTAAAMTAFLTGAR